MKEVFVGFGERRWAMYDNSDDRRSFDRFLARFPVKFKDSRQGYGTDVFLRDISAEGAKVITRQKMFPFDSVSIQVKLPDGYEEMLLNGEVIWIKSENSRVYDVGIKFFKADLMGIQRLYKFCID